MLRLPSRRGNDGKAGFPAAKGTIRRRPPALVRRDLDHEAGEQRPHLRHQQAGVAAPAALINGSRSGRSPPGRSPMPGRYGAGVMAMTASTPRFTHTPSNVSWMAAAVLDLPERGAPLRITIWPGHVSMVEPFWARHHGLVARGSPSWLVSSVAVASDPHPRPPGGSRPSGGRKRRRCGGEAGSIRKPRPWMTIMWWNQQNVPRPAGSSVPPRLRGTM